MSDALIDALNARGVAPATVPHAMRYLVSVWADDLPPSRMREQLVEEGVPGSSVDQAAALIEYNSALMEDVALSVLQTGYADDDTRALADGALDAANAKLPLVEAGLIAIVAVYGMWVAATKGRRSHKRVIAAPPTEARRRARRSSGMDRRARCVRSQACLA
jgi:hypothetical protein